MNRSYAFLLLALCAGGLMVHGQSITTGEITGSIVDASGAAMAQVPVQLTNIGTGVTQISPTDNSGNYHFPLLNPGEYVVTVEAPGFQKSQAHVTVALGQPARVDMRLRVASASTTVVVSEAATTVQTDNADVQTTYNSMQIQNLPNSGGDITAYAQLSPGAIMNTEAPGGPVYGNFSSFGLPGTSNLFTLNGENENDPYFNVNNSGATNLLLGNNDIAEMSVTTNGYSGQYGQLAGAQVNYITRSGTNDWHGNAKWMWNGRVLNANDWFNNANDVARPFDNANQWATYFAGPIVKDKTFFDVDYEGLRFVLPTVPTTVTIPTMAFETATLDHLNATGMNGEVPFYNQIFKVFNTSIGAQSATPVAGGGCGNLTALAGVSNCALQYTASPTNLSHEYMLSVRVDQNLGQNDRFYARYGKDHGFQASDTDYINPVFNVGSDQPQQQGQLSWTHVFGPRATNQLNGSSIGYSAPFGYADPTATQTALAPGLQFLDGSFGFYNPFVGQYAVNGFEAIVPSGRDVIQYQVVDDYSLALGKQTIKTGVNFHRDLTNDYDFASNYQGLLSVGTINDFYNGVIGTQGGLNQNFPSALAYDIRTYNVGLYVEDDIKVNQHLTLNLSLRGDHNSNPICVQRCFSSAGAFTELDHDPSIPYDQAIKTGLSQALPATTNIVWQPRAGFAWSMDSKTVVRGGAGIFSDAFPAFVVDELAENAPGFVGVTLRGTIGNTGAAALGPGQPGSVFDIAASTDQSIKSGFSNGGTLASLTAANPAFAAPNLASTDPFVKQPRYYEWNFEVQRDLGWHTLLSLNYVGNHGIDEFIQNNGLNAFCSACAPSFAVFPSSPLDPRFGAVTQFQTSGTSRYDGMVISVQHTLSAHVDFTFNYTWSHAMDTVSNGGILPFNDADSILFPEDPYSIAKYNYGNADYDVRQSLNGSLVFDDVVRAAHFHRGPNAIFGGWTLGANIFHRTGLPFTVVDLATAVTYEGALFATPIATTYKSCSSSAVATPNGTPCLTTGEFAPSVTTGVPLAGFPSENRNQFYGPGFFDMDMSITKLFPIGEKLHLGIGGEFYNVLNHPNFANPQNSLVDPAFGTIKYTVGVPTTFFGAGLGGDASPRLIQLKAELRF